MRRTTPPLPQSDLPLPCVSLPFVSAADPVETLSAVTARANRMAADTGYSLRRNHTRMITSLLVSFCLLFFSSLVSGDDSALVAAARAGLHPVNIATTNAATTLFRQATAAYAVDNTFDATTTQIISNADLLTAHLSGAYDITVGQCSTRRGQARAPT